MSGLKRNVRININTLHEDENEQDFENYEDSRIELRAHNLVIRINK